MSQVSQVIRVLVVDDEETIRTAVADLLSDIEWIDVVGRIDDGAQAVEASGSVSPDVILMDLRMPVMDGIEATRQISLREGAPAILMHTAYGDDSLVLEAFQAGARGYVIKGSTASDLVSAVRTVADGHAHISDEVTRPLVAKLVEALDRERQTRVAAQQAADLLARVTAQQREFAIQAAHELRTPLTTLMGTLELIADADSLEPDTTSTLARSAHRAARRFAHLAEDLEVIATGDLLELRKQAVSLRSQVEAALSELEAPSSRVSVDVDGFLVTADPARLQQVLHNVISNALTASPKESPVRITARKADGQIHIEVQDLGTGFTTEALAALFEPFSHELGAASGLGVGLAVAHRLLSRMDGSVEATNNSSGGATVRLTLPEGDA